jgi:hypothetical protein
MSLNPIQELLRLFPERNWNWINLSQNSWVTWSLVEEFSEKPWNWSVLSENPNFGWSLIQAHPEKNWSYEFLIENSSVSFTELTEIFNGGFLTYSSRPHQISANPNLTTEDVCSHPEFPWNWDLLISNSSIEISRFIQDSIPADWDYYWLSSNPQLDWTLIRRFPEYPWDFQMISWKNARLTPEIIREFRLSLDFRFLSFNKLISLRIFLDHPEAHWKLRRLLINTQDLELVRFLIFQTSLIKKLKRKYPEQSEIIEELFKSLGSEEKKLIRVQVILNNGLYRLECWQENLPSRNPYLDWREVARNPEKFNFRVLSENQFQRFPVRQRERARIRERVFRTLLFEVHRSGWQELFGLSLVLLRLRREDVLVRGCPNHSPRLLLEEEKN